MKSLAEVLEWAETLTPEQATALLTDLQSLQDKEDCEKSLAAFIRGGWHVVEPSRPLVWNWHLDTICGYLEAASRGDITRLIINIPPGSMKSLIVGVFYPAWKWATQPGHKFLCGSNESTLATRDAMKMRNLVDSPWYQERWGYKDGLPWATLNQSQKEKTLFQNAYLGHRESQGVLGKVTGKRGDTLIWDDPHDTKQTESDVQRGAVLDAWDYAWSTRVNDLDTSTRIIIMQRIHARDITAHLQAKSNQGWVTLAIPMRYDPDMTFDAGADIGRPDLNDPRTEPGELMFPGRFSEKSVKDLEADLGPYGSAGQLQQRPSPKGGGEFRRNWINHWTMQPKGGNRCILVDPAGERKPGQSGKRDHTAMGVFELCADNNYYLIDGYRDRLNLEERADILFKWHRQYRPMVVGYEQYGMQSDLASIKQKMEREGYRFKIEELGGSLRKEDRIRRLIPLFADGRLWLPETLYRTMWDGRTVDMVNEFIEKEFLPFPVAEFDDFFDMMSRLMDDVIQKKLTSPREKPSIRIRPRQMTDRAMGY